MFFRMEKMKIVQGGKGDREVSIDLPIKYNKNKQMDNKNL